MKPEEVGWGHEDVVAATGQSAYVSYKSNVFGIVEGPATDGLMSTSPAVLESAILMGRDADALTGPDASNVDAVAAGADCDAEMFPVEDG